MQICSILIVKGSGMRTEGRAAIPRPEVPARHDLASQPTAQSARLEGLAPDMRVRHFGTRARIAQQLALVYWAGDLDGGEADSGQRRAVPAPMFVAAVRATFAAAPGGSGALAEPDSYDSAKAVAHAKTNFGLPRTA